MQAKGSRARGDLQIGTTKAIKIDSSKVEVRVGDPHRSPTLVLAAALVAVSAFLLYRVTGARDITWLHQGEDGPEFAAAALTLGIPHPTGYPLYTLIGRVATLLPGMSAGGALAALSAACAAASLALLFVVACHAAGALRADASSDERGVAPSSGVRPHGHAAPMLGAAIAIITLALAPTFWSQAVITEVYTLHIALFALLFVLAIRASRTVDRASLYLLGFVAGLAMGHHLGIISVFPGIAVFLLLERRRPLDLLFAIPFFVLGASVIAFLPIRGALDPWLQWGDHEHFDGLRWVISGEQYHFRLKGFDVERFRGMLGAYVRRRLPSELGLAAYALAPAGALLLALRRPSIFLATFVPLVLSLGLTFAYEIPDPDAYYLPSYCVMVLWMAVALSAVFEWIGAALAARWQAAAGSRVLRAVAIVLLIALALAPLPTRARRIDASRDRTARDYADKALDVLPPNGLVITQGDGRTFALWEACAERGRRDAAVVYSALLCWPWYVHHIGGAFPNLRVAGTSMKPDEMVDALIAANLGEIPVFLSFSDTRRANSYELAPAGPLFEVRGRRAAPPLPSAIAEAIPLDITLYANSDYHHDPFAPDPEGGDNFFPHLAPGVLRHGEIPFHIAADFATSGIPSVITTAFQERARIVIPLDARPTRGIALALDAGAVGSASIDIARLAIEYADGSASLDTIRSNRDAWEYWEKNYGLTIPDDQILWRPDDDTSNESITMHFVSCDATRTPKSLVIEGTGAKGSDGAYAGIAIFAITQLLAQP